MSCPTLQPHELEPTRLLYPWGFPGKPGGSSPPRDPGSLVRLRFGGRILYHCAMWGVQSTIPACRAAAFPHSFLSGLTSHFLTCALLAAEMIFHPSPSTLSSQSLCPAVSSSGVSIPQSSQTAEPVKDISCSGGWPRGPSCYLPSTCGFNKHLLNICLCTSHCCRPWILNSRWGKISVRKWAR